MRYISRALKNKDIIDSGLCRENRIEKIQIRVTPEEKILISKLANCQCLDVSNFIRWVILNKYFNEFTGM